MNSVEELLIGKSDEEVKSMYEKLISERQKREAYKLRAAFIKKELTKSEEQDWSLILFDFVKEEAEFIKDMDVISMVISTESPAELEDVRKQFSQLNAFALTELDNRGFLATDVDTIIRIRKQECLIDSSDSISSATIKAFLHVYNDINPQQYREVLAEELENNFHFFQNASKTLLFNSEIAEYASGLEEVSTNVTNNPDATSDEKHFLKLGLAFMALILLVKEEVDEAKLYLEKTLHLTGKEETLYNVLVYLLKEFNLLIEV